MKPFIRTMVYVGKFYKRANSDGLPILHDQKQHLKYKRKIEKTLLFLINKTILYVLVAVSRGYLLSKPSRFLTPLRNSVLVKAALQPQFPCSKVSRKTG